MKNNMSVRNDNCTSATLKLTLETCRKSFPIASRHCYWASEFCSKLAQQAGEGLGELKLHKNYSQSFSSSIFSVSGSLK